MILGRVAVGQGRKDASVPDFGVVLAGDFGQRFQIVLARLAVLADRLMLDPMAVARGNRVFFRGESVRGDPFLLELAIGIAPGVPDHRIASVGIRHVGQ